MTDPSVELSQTIAISERPLRRPNCGCLDIDGNGTLDQADVQRFAATLIFGPLLPCL